MDLRWGAERPAITLVGKGVTFDTGGMNLKPGASMSTMKKDMGGSAFAIAFAQAIMALKLPVRLRLLVPAVENTVSDLAFRPQDVIDTRKGISVEIGNTDAEGRLILADALTEACTEKPDMVLDFATLTGAARVAMGTEVPAFFATDTAKARALQDLSGEVQDWVWQLPLHKPYKRLLKSNFADCNNIGSTGMGGAITAALFLQQFVEADIPWMHFDMMAWNTGDQPGRPKGGEVMGLVALLAWLEGQI